MMGSNERPQAELFHAFNPDDVVPQDHLLRDIDRMLDLSELREHLAPYYSHTGRPSVDPDSVYQQNPRKPPPLLHPEHLRHVVPRNELEVLSLFRRDVPSILNDEETCRIALAQRCAGDIEAVGFGRAVNAESGVCDDVEEADPLVVAFAPVDGVVVGALVGCDEVTAALGADPQRDAFDVVREPAIVAGAVDQHPVRAALGLGGIFPETMVLFRDIQCPELIVGHAAFGL